MNQPAADLGELLIPEHMNQFHRLGPNGTTGEPWGPLWGRDYNHLNCAYTIAAMAARFATRDKWRPEPNDLRRIRKDHEGGAIDDGVAALGVPVEDAGSAARRAQGLVGEILGLAGELADEADVRCKHCRIPFASVRLQ